MALYVLLPGALNGGLECQHEDLAPLHSLCKLIGGERLAEAHLCIPKELGCTIRLAFARLTQVIGRHLNRRRLLRAHRERPVPCARTPGSLTCRDDCRAHIALRAQEPFVTLHPGDESRAPHALKPPVHVLVRERRSVRPHRALPHDYARRSRKARSPQLLLHARFDVTLRVADLQIALVRRYAAQFVGVNRRRYFRTLREEVCRHGSTPSA